MPHGSAPNESSNCRYAQFLKFFSAEIPEERLEKRKKGLMKELESEGTLEYVDTPLAKKLYGFEKW